VIKHYFSRQFLRFLAVGATAAVFHWISRYLLSIWLPFSLAVVFAYIVGIAIAFELNRKYVFPSSNRPVRAQARDFLLTNLAFFPIVWGAAVLLRQLLRDHGVYRYADGIAHGLAIAIPVLITFLIYKFIAFGDGNAEQRRSG